MIRHDGHDQKPLGRWLEKLEGVKRVGTGFEAFCPAHNNANTPALGITEAEDGKVLVICRSQRCNHVAIAKALGLEESDYFPARNDPKAKLGTAKPKQTYPTPEAAVQTINSQLGLLRHSGVWAYHDRHGMRVGVVARWDLPSGTKEHRPITLTAAGWTIEAMPAPAPLYKLPTIINADLVNLFEGEKAAEAAASIGMTVSTWAGGSNAYRKVDWNPLAGKTVNLFPDNDDAGRKAMRAVASILKNLSPPANVKIIELPGLPVKGDIVEWIEAHGDAAEPETMLAEIELIAANAVQCDELYTDDGSTEGEDESGASAPEPLLAWTPKPINSRDFARGDFRHEWIAKGFLVKGEPAVLYGQSKTLKTSLLVEFAICVACGLPVFGMFAVPVRRRVIIISGESGERTLQALAFRVCGSKGIQLEDIGENLIWEFSVPPIADLTTLIILTQLLKDHAIDVMILEPAYLALMSGGGDPGSAANMFAMGTLLGGLSEACNAAGAQLILGHHTNSTIRVGDEPNLTHIAFSGFQQFARQWIGVNRREHFNHDGIHKLRLVIGSSAGHCGDFVIDIDEGVLNDDFTGRKWELTIAKTSEVRKQVAEGREGERSDKVKAAIYAENNRLLEAIDMVAVGSDGLPPATGATKRRLRTITGWQSTRLNEVVERLVEFGKITPITVKISTGNRGSKRECEGYCRVSVSEQLGFDDLAMGRVAEDDLPDAKETLPGADGIAPGSNGESSPSVRGELPATGSKPAPDESQVTTKHKKRNQSKRPRARNKKAKAA